MDVRFRIACCLLLAVANAAKSDESATPMAENSQSQRLVIGDYYKLEVVSGPARGEFEGRLIKANEKWLVLLAGKQRKWLDCTWVPREAAKIVGRHNAGKNVAVPAIESEYPRSKGEATVIVARGKTLERHWTRVVGVKDSNLVLADERVALNSVLCVFTEEPLVEAIK